ncbi:MAG TPA: phosphotransferase [Micromonosporaceae bacterium]|nr:phosphotransferase [Micromonosporaceae bacterium]
MSFSDPRIGRADDVEHRLPGRATSGLVRIGDTVRRPAGPWTDSVDAVLAHLRDVGFTGAPRPLGRDEFGRQIVEFVPGEMCDEAGTFSLADLASVGAFVHDLHEALATFVPPDNPRWQVVIPPDREEQIVHHDVAPWNLVRSARGWVLIDWDAAAPGSRLWDLAYAAQAMAGLNADRPAEDSARRLRVFADAYRLDAAARPALARVLPVRARAMYDMLAAAARDGREPWASIHATDGAYWRQTADYLDAHVDVFTSTLTDDAR